MAMTDAQTDRLFDSILIKLENRLERQILGNFRQLTKSIRDIVESGGEVGGNIIILENQQELQKILQDAYFEAIREGAKFTYKETGQEPPDEDDLSALLLLLLGWVTVTSIQHAQFLTDTTIDIFNTSYQNAIEAGEMGLDIAKTVSRDMQKRNKSRVKVIGTTEANMAFQTGSLEAGKQLDVQLLKRWVSQQDKRVRPTHVSANSRYRKKPIPIGALFSVGAGQGLRPLDPMLPSEEIIQCRCYMRMVLPENIPIS